MTQYGRRLWALILLVTLVRALAARWIPLTEDEAYYRLWSQHLRLGYFDHPPMIAWWIRAGVTLTSDNPLGVRLLPVLGAGASTWLAADLARRLGLSGTVSLTAALWYNAAITIGVGGILATPDASATLFWTATLWTLGRIAGGGAPPWWMAAGACAGLACLSKYSALFLAPGVVLWLALSEDGRRRLLTPWPWLAAVIAGGIFGLNVAWNAQNGWLTFAKQFGRVEPSRFQPSHLVELLAAQVVLLNPMIAVYAARGASLAWRDRVRPGAPDLTLPLLTGAPFAAYLVIHSLHDRVQAHWPAPLYSGLAIAAAAAAAAGLQTPAARRLRNLGAGATLALSAALLAFAAIPGTTSAGRFDPLLPLRGWPALARDINRLQESSGAAWVGTVSYGAYAQLMATREVRAPVIQVIERARYPDEAARPDFARPGLMVDLERRLKPADLALCFTEVRPVGVLVRSGPPGPRTRYPAYLVSGPKDDLLARGCPGNLGKKAAAG